MLFGRPVHTRLPELCQPAPNDDLVRNRDKAQKHKIKQYADKKRGSRPKEIKVGDQVLVKNSGKFHRTPYRSAPYEVTAVKGTMVTARCNDHLITRNVSCFKLYRGPLAPDVSSDAESSYGDADRDVVLPDMPEPGPPVRRNPPRNHHLPARLHDYVVN